MRGLMVVLLLGALISGCSLIRVGPAVEVQKVHLEDDAAKNLDAVRAFQADQERRSTSSAADAARSSQSILHPDSPALSSIPSSVAPVVPTDDPRKTVPWTPPSISTHPDHSVPDHKVPAPVAPEYPGATRCVPNELGGQRCMIQ